MANATFTGNGTGANLYGYMHARVVAERTDSTTSSSIVVKCYAVSDGGSSSFISGKASKDASGTLGSASSEMSVGSGGTTLLKTEAAFTVARGASAKTVPAKAQIIGGGTGMYSGRTDTATVNVPVPALASYAVTYDGNRPSTASGDVSGVVSDVVSGVVSGATAFLQPKSVVIRIIAKKTEKNLFILYLFLSF